MYELMVQLEFQAAHRLRDYDGKCARLHGHGYRVDVFIGGEGLDDNDMLVDFGEVRRASAAVLDQFDHRYLNELPAFRECSATAERIAHAFYERLSDAVDTDRYRVTKVRVWETPECAATYAPTRE